MRGAFVETLVELAAADDRVFLLTADLGWNALEPFSTAFPQRFVNIGVAEQNMAGIAMGLAHLGYIPFIYSIATFASMRCYEQIRNGALLHAVPLRIIGIGGGYAYGHAGPTHFALEDVAVFRAQPGMTVLVPADPSQTRTCLLATQSLKGPVYLRIGKGGNATIPGLNGRFRLGEPEVVQEGKDILFLTCGSITEEVLKAAALLNHRDVSSAVAVVAHLPFQGSSALRALVSNFRIVVTVEEAYSTGGLGSLVGELIAQTELKSRLIRIGKETQLNCDSGTERFMRSLNNLDAASIADSVEKRYKLSCHDIFSDTSTLEE
jgi:transketolase